ncbi:MAG: phosphoglycerate dehydrogenase [Candidatus Omnitrophota bacterium]|nr:phosphoglycerate dehydrogenase [Candidatus Omnitrophota bacterium]
MKTFKVLVSDALSKQGLEILKKEKRLEVNVKTGLSPEELKIAIKDYQGIIIRSKTKLTADIIDNAKLLKVIGRAGVGLDNVDVTQATKKGIVVMNAPGGNTVSTAEHTMSMILALSRNIPQANSSLRKNKWDRKKFMGVELYGKILGIIGLGRIGSEVVKRALSFGMEITAYDPYCSVERAKGLKVKLTELKEVFRQADYITVHTPLIKETKHLISKKEIGLMKKGVRIINCARGGIVDEQALLKGLKSGKVAGAAMDVFEKEPPIDNPLLKLDNVIFTPHLGASTEEAQVNVAVDIARQMADALLDRGIKNAANMPTVPSELLKIIQPYITLAGKMGSLQMQLSQGRLQRIKIKYSGEVINFDLAPITIALIKGLLEPILPGMVNYVNAPLIAKERGIEVVEVKSSASLDFTTLISLEIQTDKMKSAVCGTLFGKNDPRIVMIDDYHVDAAPFGYMIITFNEDKPGIIGRIGTVLGENNVNIAGMTFGRRKKAGKAITVINVDSPVSDGLLKRIKQLKWIKDVKLLKL